MIVYFTGTGNSRFVAERLAEKTGDALTDAASYIREGKRAEFTEPGTYVFVAPVYVSAPALPFLDFIRASSFPDNVRAYFIMCCTSYMGASRAYCQKIAREKGFSYLGTAMVCMPQNYLLYFKTYGDEVNLEKLREALPVMDKLAEVIRAGRELPVPELSLWDLLSTKMILEPYYRFFMKADGFYVTDACIGCGSCVRVCPLGNITLKEGRPVWGKKCVHCVGCINLCPKQAIEFGKRTAGKLRYPGPDRLYAQLKKESDI